MVPEAGNRLVGLRRGLDSGRNGDVPGGPEGDGGHDPGPRYETGDLVQVFQCHRTGHKWAWKQDADSVDYILSITRTVSEPANVALVMDLSAEIVDTRILSAVGEQTKIYHLTIATPNGNFVQTPEIQNQFVVKFREAMEAIKNENPQIDCIRVFMAMPASLAVRAGMDFMPKADVPLVLYEQATADDGFFEALTIGG